MGTREKILAAARKAFEQHGLEGLSLREVAAKVGITPMAIYRHFESKEALIDALVLDALEEWSARVAALPAAEGIAKLEQLSEALLAFALRAPRRFEAAFLLPSRKARRYPDDFAAGRSPAGNVALRALEEGIRQGKLAGAPPVEMMLIISALSQGLVTLYRAGRIAGGEEGFRSLYHRAMGRAFQSFMVEKFQ
jgi:AcrR family transcriptional regulator